MEVAGTGEGLTDDSRSDKRPISVDELTVRFRVKEQLSYSSHHERIRESECDGCYSGIEARGNDELLHRWLLCEMKCRDCEIDELDSNEGCNDAAEAVDEKVPTQERSRRHGPIADAAKCERNQSDDD